MKSDGWIWALLTTGLVAVAAVLALVGPAPAQDRAAWFKSLKQPGTGISCCDVSDCKRRQTRWVDGGWQALIPDWSGKESWVDIPPEKVLRSTSSIDGHSYTCSSGSLHIFCFVPPDPGS